MLFGITKDHCVPGRPKGGEWTYTEELRYSHGFPVDQHCSAQNLVDREILNRIHFNANKTILIDQYSIIDGTSMKPVSFVF